jgi:hypothetical protein
MKPPPPRKTYNTNPKPKDDTNLPPLDRLHCSNCLPEIARRGVQG